MVSRRGSEETARRLAHEDDPRLAEMGRIIGSSLQIDEVYERFAKEVRLLRGPVGSTSALG